MSSERMIVALERDDDEWTALVVTGPALLVDHEYKGSGPADVLEQLGQTLDEREVARIRRERGI